MQTRDQGHRHPEQGATPQTPGPLDPDRPAPPSSRRHADTPPAEALGSAPPPNMDIADGHRSPSRPEPGEQFGRTVPEVAGEPRRASPIRSQPHPPTGGRPDGAPTAPGEPGARGCPTGTGSGHDEPTGEAGSQPFAPSPAAPANASETLRPMGRIDLPGEFASVAKARRYVRVLLTGIAHPRIDDAVLLVSELVSNAVRHSDSALPGGKVTVSVAHGSGTLHIDVTDAGSAVNKPQLPAGIDHLGSSGRGLWLVDELSSAWGWYETDGGRVVWFRLTDG